MVRKYETSSEPARAEYYFEFKYPFVEFGGWNGWLRADIKDQKLITSTK